MTGRELGRLTAVAALALAVALPGSPAWAEGNRGSDARSGHEANAGNAVAANMLQTLKTKGDDAIDKRLASVDEMKKKVADSKDMTAEHKARLQSKLDAAAPGLTALKAKIDSATSLDSLRPLLKSITRDFRVYMLVEPQVRLTKGIDGVVAGAGRIDSATTKLDGIATQAKANGADTAAIEASLVVAHNEEKAAIEAALSQSDAVLKLEPGSDDADTAELKVAASNLGEAAKHLRAARDALKQARDGLRVIVDKSKVDRSSTTTITTP